MTVVDLRKAGRDAAGRIESGMTYRNPQDIVTSREVSLTRPSLSERVYIAVRDASGEWLTRADIAKALGLKKTPYLHRVIETLVDARWIERYEGDAKSRNMAQYWYRLPDAHKFST